MVAIVRCVPACRTGGSGGAVAAVRGPRPLSGTTTGPRATRVTATARGCFRPHSVTAAPQDDRTRFTSHPFSSGALSRPSRGSSFRVVSCSDTRCRVDRSAAPRARSAGAKISSVLLHKAHPQ
ncbi:hypothetical protein F0344_29510 [Streptomyces finlayi]|uniref:Uncharacterized protein n=1 Tax=Streptomyces finlayi TaxID=67296 RepID=A0A7G7BS72_9ACTN|nr:hypothetical protein F0344_29510 [Streptomyces finlayi]